MATIKLQNGDSLELLKQYPDNYFDSVVTDPPYGLGFMGKEWDKPENIAFNPEFWTEVYRVLKPGGHLLAFSASRTYHRMAVAIEDSGFEIRDQIMWIYGSGFPKSQDLAKMIEKKENKDNLKTITSKGAGTASNVGNYARGNQETNNLKSEYQEVVPTTENATKWNGWGSALKPAHEPIVMARKPFKGTLVNNTLTNGVGAINIDESRIANTSADEYDLNKRGISPDSTETRTNKETLFAAGLNAASKRGVGEQGRFPANVIHDGSEEVINAFPSTKKGGSITKDTYEIKNQVYGQGWGNASLHQSYGDEGSAARFFYGSKCSKVDRNEGLEDFEHKETWASQEKRQAHSFDVFESDGRKKTLNNNNHPTVKPTDLMAYLVRLVTPKDGIVLDPFNGSGSTGKAVVLLNKTENKNYSYVGMELDPQYIKITHARMLYTMHNKTWLEKKNGK